MPGTRNPISGNLRIEILDWCRHFCSDVHQHHELRYNLEQDLTERSSLTGWARRDEDIKGKTHLAIEKFLIF